MKVREIADKKIWEEFVQAHGPKSGSFLHAWEYGDLDRGSSKLGVYEEDELVAVALVSDKNLPVRLSYGLIQRGPIVKEGVGLASVVQALVSTYAKKTFLRFEPLVSAPSTAKETIHVSPEETLLLDLASSEEELLSAMHKKTRYNIRLAQKRGVEVRELLSGEFDEAWMVFQETASRDAFRLHSKKRYVQWITTVSGARLVGAFYGGKLLAVNLMIDYAGVRTYLHGASSNTHRNVMAPYALHWHEILQAKKAGLSTYDFWGVSDMNPAWKGITRFKLGFGGERMKYPGTFDQVIQPNKYRLYRLLRMLRRRGK